MDLYRSLAGVLEIRIICADPAGMITLLEQKCVELRDVRLPDELTLIAQIPRGQWSRVQTVCDKTGVDLQEIGRKGVFWRFQELWHRPVLVFGMILVLLIGFYVPSRIFFIRVEGNVTIPQRLILETAAQCGIRFGANRREVRSEKMKNALLEAMPQLQWAGVNTNGCVAVISVRERQKPEVTEKPGAVGSIVAARDGVITQITATRGNSLCKVGQAVKAGEILISGYTDCGISIRADSAKGEVFALTERQITAICPTTRQFRGDASGQEVKYSLIIGKNRINFYFGSGISHTTCVKMYEENYMTLPGGFQLPVVLVKETILQYPAEEGVLPPREGMPEAFARNYLTGQLVAGRILTEAIQRTEEEQAVILHGQYACNEMIGLFREEEIIKPDGTNN